MKINSRIEDSQIWAGDAQEIGKGKKKETEDISKSENKSQSPRTEAMADSQKSSIIHDKVEVFELPDFQPAQMTEPRRQTLGP